MKFTPTPFKEAFVIEQEPHGDERGFFARQFCVKEFQAQGLPTNYVQVNNSLSKDLHTLRGMHYQLPPAAETKLVRCIAGALFDVIIDMRAESPTYKQHFGVTLSAQNRLMLVAPKGFAHGFLTLEPDTEALYFVDEFYSPGGERGVRFDDPAIGIEWPATPAVISDKDANWPYL